MSLGSLLFVYCVLVLLASYLGGHISSVIRMTHLRTQLLMSFVGGLMLGIAMLHLLPHASELVGSPTQTGIAMLFGVVGMFLLLRLFHEHHHHGPTDTSEHRDCQHLHHQHDADAHQDHSGDHKHRDTEHPVAVEKARGFGWIGMLFGMWLHTIVDGVALAASTMAEFEHGAWMGLAGVGTFLAVALHKPLDAFAITSTMRASGWKRSYQNTANIVFCLACPMGASLFYFGIGSASENSQMLGWGLAVSAGFFLCIALADLLPEVSFHNHDRGKLTAMLFAGIALAIAIENLPGHSHDHSEHEGHDHGAHIQASE